MSYQLTVEKRPNYLHTKVVGERTPQNALRYLEEVYTACVNGGHSKVLLEMHLSGPSLSTTSVFEVISRRVPAALKLRKIAYVEAAAGDPATAAFAETVAANRGVNVRLFPNVAEAASWLDTPSGGTLDRRMSTPI